MISSSLLSVGAFGLLAQAFVVPDVKSFSEIKDHLPSTQGSGQTINLDCSTCPYALSSARNGFHEWTNDVASNLEMKFTSEDNTLKMNDVPLYPLENPTLPPRLTVKQSKQDPEARMEGYKGELGLSYSMEYNEQKFEEGSLVTMLMTVMGLDHEMIKVDNVEIKAIKGTDGQLTLHSVTTVPASPDSPDAKCANILCRVFTKMITGVNKAKASAKGAAHKMKCFCVKCMHKITGHKHNNHSHPQTHNGEIAVPHRRPDGTMELPTHIQFKPAGHQGHHHHQHKGFMGRMAMVLSTIVHVVLIPILVGVAFGMAASAIGMLVGQAIVFVWMKFRRTPETGAYERVETDEKVAPPPYQDVQNAEVLTEKDVRAEV